MLQRIEQMKKEKKERASLISRAKNLIKRGEEFYLQGKYFDAKTQYTIALELLPLSFVKTRSKALVNIAATFIKTDQKKEALEKCNEALELDPDCIIALLIRCQIFEDFNMPNEARNDMEKIKTYKVEDVNLAMSQYNLGLDLFKTSLVAVAIDLKNKGNASFSSGEYSEALNHYQEAIRLSPFWKKLDKSKLGFRLSK